MHISTRSNRLSSMGGYGILSGFGDLPSDVKAFILQNNPNNPDETNKLVANPDGLNHISSWPSRWSAVVALSKQVDQVRGDPAASALNSIESGLANALTTAILKARDSFPWAAVFNRSSSQQAALDAALDTIDNTMTQYMAQVPPLLASTVKAIADRTAAAQAAQTATANAQAAVAKNVTVTQQASTALAQRALDAAQRPAWLIPAAIGGGVIVLLGVAGIVMKARNRPAMAGYRSRR